MKDFDLNVCVPLCLCPFLLVAAEMSLLLSKASPYPGPLSFFIIPSALCLRVVPHLQLVMLMGCEINICKMLSALHSVNSINVRYYENIVSYPHLYWDQFFQGSGRDHLHKENISS